MKSPALVPKEGAGVFCPFLKHSVDQCELVHDKGLEVFYYFQVLARAMRARQQ